MVQKQIMHDMQFILYGKKIDFFAINQFAIYYMIHCMAVKLRQCLKAQFGSPEQITGDAICIPY